MAKGLEEVVLMQTDRITALAFDVRDWNNMHLLSQLQGTQ